MTRKAAVVGVGYSSVHREKGVDGRALAVAAAREAIADAGLRVSDVDAIFEYAGDELSYDMARMLGIENLVAYGDFAPRDPVGARCADGGAVRLLRGCPGGPLSHPGVGPHVGAQGNAASIGHLAVGPALRGRRWDDPDQPAISV